MATLQKDQILQFRGQQLYDADGDKIGAIEEIYLDAETDAPEWALVKTGLFGSKSTFVPLRDASDTGGALRVPFDKATVKGAPKMDASSTATTAWSTPRRARTPGYRRAAPGPIRSSAGAWATTSRAARPTTR